MFDYVRDNKRVVQVVLGLLMLPFAFFGVNYYFQGSGQQGAEVASVAGYKINQQELSKAQRDYQDQMRERLGANFDATKIDTPEVRRALLDNLIRQRVVADAALRSNLAVSSEEVLQRIREIPAFQKNGQFSVVQFEQLVQQQGMSPEMFASRMQQDIQVSQLVRAVEETAVVPSSLLTRWNSINEQQREVADFQLTPEQYIEQVKLGPDAARKHYDGHKKDFELPEQVRAEYVVLTADALSASVTVNPEDVRKYYDSHIKEYSIGEQRRASHILLNVAPDAKPEEVAKVKTQAEDLLKQAHKAPGTFGDLAKRHSQDTGSAVNGGDLGFFGRDAMVKPFEEVAFALKEGEMAGPVKSEFGFHVIKLTGIKPGAARPFEQVRPEIEKQLKQLAASKKYAEAAEGFSNLAYEQADSLKPVADKYNLKIQQSDWMTRTAQASYATFSNQKLLSAVYSDEVLHKKHNSEAVEVGGNTLVVARLLEHKVAAERPFEQVEAQIRAMLTTQEADQLAKKSGAAKLEAVRQGNESGVRWGPPRLVSRQKAGGLPFQAVEQIFKSDVSKLPAYVGVDLPRAGYAVFKISRVTEPTQIDANRRKQLRQMLEQVYSRADFDAYVEALRERGKIKINSEALEKKER